MNPCDLEGKNAWSAMHIPEKKQIIMYLAFGASKQAYLLAIIFAFLEVFCHVLLYSPSLSNFLNHQVFGQWSIEQKVCAPPIKYFKTPKVKVNDYVVNNSRISEKTYVIKLMNMIHIALYIYSFMLCSI